MSFRVVLGLVSTLLSAACVISVDGAFNTCAYTAERTVTSPSQGASRVRIVARAGSLDIRGQSGLSEARVTGTACARDEDDLARVELLASEGNGEVLIEVRHPDRARLDMVLELSDALRIDVTDSSGWVEIHNVAGVTLRDGSGHITMEHIGGDVTVADGSGGIEIRDVAGSLVIEDDGSGHIEIAQVQGDVLVEEDGSGEIEVADVRGDFTVLKGGSGGIRSTNVGGRISAAR